MKKKKIAIVVPNPCNPDYRVIRQAETFARAGHDVRIFATKNAGTPAYEKFNDVEYIRSHWHVGRDFVTFITGLYKARSALAPRRNEYEKILRAAKSNARRR